MRVPVYHPSPNVSRPVTQLTEEEQVKIAKRIGLIQHLPSGFYDGSKKARECVFGLFLLFFCANLSCTIRPISFYYKLTFCLIGIIYTSDLHSSVGRYSMITQYYCNTEFDIANGDEVTAAPGYCLMTIPVMYTR